MRPQAIIVLSVSINLLACCFAEFVAVEFCGFKELQLTISKGVIALALQKR